MNDHMGMPPQSGPTSNLGSANQPDNETTPQKIIKDSQIAGFWRRLFAFLIDGFLLWLVGLAMIYLSLMYQPSAFGYGVYLGFGLALLYFGIMNSHIRRGQTIGKMILGIEVVDREGHYLSLGKSFLRAAMLSSLICFQNFGALTWLVFGYLYIFNRVTRQSLHDVIAGTFVVKKGANQPHTAHTWKVHYVIAVILFAFSFWPVIAAITGGKTQGDPALQGMITEIQKIETVKEVNVRWDEWGRLGDPNKQKRLIVGVVVKQPTPQLEDKIAKIVIDKYPPDQSYDRIIVQLGEVRSMGIATNTMNYNYNFSPQLWRERIDKMDNNK